MFHPIWRAAPAAALPQPRASRHCQLNKDINGDGTVDMAIKMTTSPPVGGVPVKSYVFKIDEYEPDGTTLIDTHYEPSKRTSKRFDPVVAGHVYKVSVAGVSFNGIEGAFSASTPITPTGKTTGPTDPAALSVLPGVMHVRVGWSLPPDKDYLHTEVWRAVNSTVFSNAALQTAVHGTVYYDEGANVSGNTYSYWIIHVNRSGIPSNRYPTGTSAGVSPNNVAQSQLQAYSVSEAFKSTNNTAQGPLAVGTAVAIETVTCAHGSDCVLVQCTLYFRNISGGARTMDVSLRDATGTIYQTWPGVTLADNEPFSASWDVDTLTGSSTNFKIFVNPAGSTLTVNNTRLSARTGRR